MSGSVASDLITFWGTSRIPLDLYLPGVDEGPVTDIFIREQLSQLTCPPCPSPSLEWLSREAVQWAVAEKTEKHWSCDPADLAYALPESLYSWTYSSCDYLLKTCTHIVAELYILNFCVM